MIERIYIAAMCCISGALLCLGTAVLIVGTLCTEPRSNERSTP